MYLLNIDENHKTVKGQKFGYMTGIMYLAPSTESGVMNVCPFSSPACSNDCLYTAGRGVFAKTKLARIKRTTLLKTDKKFFVRMLILEIMQLQLKADMKKLTPLVRLNGTSDLPFENFGIMKQFPNIQFYDYTKSHSRMIQFLNGKMPKNYYLVFSQSEINENETMDILSKGGNVAVVFHKIPELYKGYKVVDGDLSDLRFLDEKNVVVGLKAKGRARKDKTSGFVI